MNQICKPECVDASLVERVHCELSSVVIRIQSAHELALVGACDSEKREAILEAIAAICESAGRVLDECAVKLGGTRTSDFYQPLKHWEDV